MTMEVVEKSKRENDSSPVSTAASITWNEEEEEKSAGVSNSEKSETPNTDSPRDDNAQVFAEANDPAICRPSPSRSDTPEEDVEDEKGVPLSGPEDRAVADNAEDSTTPRKDDESPASEEPSGNVEKLTAKNETGDSREVISGPVTPQQPLTFTINFGDDKEVDTARYRNLFERYNARHKRNSSTSKVEVKSKKAPEAPVLTKQKTPSAHSEGYFSSDPEDDTRRKADQLSRKLKQLGKNL